MILILLASASEGWSLTSSIFDYLYVNGRRYQNFRDGYTLLPNDEVCRAPTLRPRYTKQFFATTLAKTFFVLIRSYGLFSLVHR